MVTKSQTNPKPRKMRGVGTYEGDDFTFRPCEQGEPTQLNVKTCKGGKTYETTSEKKPQRVAHLSCPADTADLWREYTAQLKRLGIKPLTPQQPETTRVVKENGLECYLNEQTQELTVQTTLSLPTHFRNWQAELLRQVQLVVRRLPASETFNKAINNLKNQGGTRNV